ncbi:MAG: hypothetical protein ABIU29_12500, partial [Chthoniobacterales bacterium]
YPDCRFVIDPTQATTLDGAAAAGHPFYQIGSFYLNGTDDLIALYRQAYPWATFVEDPDHTTGAFGQWRIEGCGPDACGSGGGGGGACAGEINVEEPGGVSLTDNSSTPVVFPGTIIGNSQSLSFFVKNVSTTESLSVGAINIDGTNASDFVVTQNPTSDGNGGLTFIVRFAPGGLGTRAAVLHLDNSDCDENPFDIVLSGIGQGAGGPLTGRLANISTRLNVGLGDNVLICGFIVSGAAPKNVVVRALGPSLTQYGVPGVLADPTLELHSSAGLIAANDDWGSQQAETEASGFAPSEDLESALVMSLGADTYTAIVSGYNETRGVALVEAYDIALEADSELLNLSTRGFVDTGDNVMIGGVILVGGNLDVLVRAIGPELTVQGVTGALQDTTLELHDKDGALIAFSDDWKEGGDQLRVEATGIPPTDDRESAIRVTLAPDNYTAIVRGKDGTTGVALVEVYNVTP